MLEGFEKWYSQYPNKKARGAAEKAWEKLKPDEKMVDDMVIALQIQKRWRIEAGKAGEFVPPWKMPATWLNGKCWLDEVGSFSELKSRQNVTHDCVGGGRHCEKVGFTQVDDKWLCPWCWSEKYGDLSALRDGYRRHGLGRMQGETQESYRLRLIRTAKEAAARVGSRQRPMAQNPDPHGSGDPA